MISITKTLPWMVLTMLFGLATVYQAIKRDRTLKTAYVTTAKLYAEFALSKELDAQLKMLQTTRQSILDSLELQLVALERKLATSRATDSEQASFGRLRQEYSLKQQQFGEDNALLTQRYQEQIATQLNQYLKDFTEDQGYDYLFGATGAGSLLGANEGYDVTDAVLVYVNERYKGVAK